MEWRLAGIAMTQHKFKFWGWGYAHEQASQEEREHLKRFYATRFSVTHWDEVKPPVVSEISLPLPRISAPESLRAIHLMMTVTPAVIMVFVIATAYFYRLDEATHSEMVAEIEARG